MTRGAFEASLGPDIALFVGTPDDVIAKIMRNDAALGGIARITFQMNAASLPHAKMMRGIEAVATRVASAMRVAHAVLSR
jgi:hypothetical protein